MKNFGTIAGVLSTFGVPLLTAISFAGPTELECFDPGSPIHPGPSKSIEICGPSMTPGEANSLVEKILNGPTECNLTESTRAQNCYNCRLTLPGIEGGNDCPSCNDRAAIERLTGPIVQPIKDKCQEHLQKIAEDRRNQVEAACAKSGGKITSYNWVCSALNEVSVFCDDKQWKDGINLRVSGNSCRWTGGFEMGRTGGCDVWTCEKPSKKPPIVPMPLPSPSVSARSTF